MSTARPDRPANFADRLIARVRELGHPLCLGLDPHLPLIPPLFRRGTMEAHDPATAAQVAQFLCTVLDRYRGFVAAVKPQVAFFEQMGARGFAALEQVIAHARSHDFLVVLDAKRGDINSTAAAYAQCLRPESPLRCDALTVNPYLGNDALEPFAQAASECGAGVFVLVKTSNQGAADLQDLECRGQRLFERVASLLAPRSLAFRGASGWSSFGAVVGARYPEDAQRVRELLPHALFLVPGFGAQGADAHAALAGFVAGPHGREGGIVNSSRALLFPSGSNTDNARAWEQAIDTARDRTIAALHAAVQRIS
ncbi:MAG: orotidine-5'-phosphate decarboxylase [Candidatus Binatia bacterium]|nr:orotidine-5'-phosphate decarboxylase [Candidatus Binatia bacterium]